jgi:serine/threonine-protein phosphatase 2B catalytic subunit
LCDLLWSDPVDESHDNWVSNKMRSCSYYYSRNQAMRFLNANNLKLIIRGHEVQMRGYKYQQAPDSTPLTLTLFSAPKYCDSYKNKGAVAILNVTPHPRRARTSRSSPSRRWSTPSC